MHRVMAFLRGRNPSPSLLDRHAPVHEKPAALAVSPDEPAGLGRLTLDAQVRAGYAARVARGTTMTEAEWIACGDPEKMLEVLRGKVSGRKLRLAAVGCCWQVASLLPCDERCRRALEVAEGYADRCVSRQELAAAYAAAEAACFATHRTAKTCRHMARVLAAHAVQWASHPTKRGYLAVVTDQARFAVGWAARPPAVADSPEAFSSSSNNEAAAAAEASLGAAQTILLRDIFGNPFHTTSPLLKGVITWNDATVHRIAEGIYQERAFERLGILADALLDAGCEDEELIGHCRSEGPHVRGCWGVDLILGRS